MSLKKIVFYTLSAVSIAFLTLSCVNAAKEKSATLEANAMKSYDLSKPVKFNMAQTLFEISGIAFNKGDAKEIYAIQDEDGELFQFNLNDKTPKALKFGGHGDYEDLTIVNNQVIVLKSNGELHQFPLSAINGAEVKDVKKIKDLVPKAEYEGIASIEKSKMVYILTKDSKADSKEKASTVYSFHLNGKNELEPKSIFKISHKEIEELDGSKKSRYRPSALVFNQKTEEWFVLSSVNKQLTVTDANFKVKATYKLNGNIFNQPEGIALDSNNNLYISNEGGKLAAGNILMFKYHP
ncbi:SdiA-regulated domain-containing protein [Pedobacter sp. UYP30]|uniref:SdiA-regulated domain-containing protein n=1 Tax=Pedobacter sp. UYP30 TaxID=1756400 RepID=UPI0033998FBA